jgi:hypothetical protein
MTQPMVGVIQILMLVLALCFAAPITPEVPTVKDASTVDPAWVQAQVRTYDLTDDERKWEDVNWVDNIDVALEMSRRYDRPLLILTHYGTLDGRC